ncbi:hypothetical protein niasHT_000372 [Heterodera trifolii]|uniref:Serine-threonine/tyrosine-protein kinase catalytic domain-containing protein n=1 Tax=Heterodera trifolii TaxID=157864 RepID=A0ABD2MC50_9BILA
MAQKIIEGAEGPRTRPRSGRVSTLAQKVTEKAEGPRTRPRSGRRGRRLCEVAGAASGRDDCCGLDGWAELIVSAIWSTSATTVRRRCDECQTRRWRWPTRWPSTGTTEVPYDKMPSTTVWFLVGSGKLQLHVPKTAPCSVSFLLTLCWAKNPRNRPSFKQF